jgi:hypothetical protein
MNLCSWRRMYTQPRNLSSGESSGPGRCCGWGEGEHNRSRASWVNNVGTAPAQDRCGSTRERWLMPEWTDTVLEETPQPPQLYHLHLSNTLFCSYSSDRYSKGKKNYSLHFRSSPANKSNYTIHMQNGKLLKHNFINVKEQDWCLYFPPTFQLHFC